MRVLALDVGDRRIGVALSDPSGTIASPLATLHRVSEKKDQQVIADLVQEYSVEQVVLGLPKTLGGDLGPQAQKVLRFGEHLTQVLGVPLAYWDERYSTVDAQRIVGRGSRRRRSQRRGAHGFVDDVAAAVILQSYLDSHGEARTGD